MLAADTIATPRSSRFDGDVNEPPPYTGNGFAGNLDSKWRPEYQVPDGATPLQIGDGAKLWQVGPDGPRLVGVWNGRHGVFVQEMAT